MKCSNINIIFGLLVTCALDEGVLLTDDWRCYVKLTSPPKSRIIGGELRTIN